MWTNKPRKAGAVPKQKSSCADEACVTNEAIAKRAYDKFVSRGCSHGNDLQDWLEAERELKTKSNGR